MKITVASGGAVIAQLSGTELEFYGVTYDRLDYSSRSTRVLIEHVVCAIRKEVDSEFSLKGRTQIEVMPDGDSGCLLIFTKTVISDTIRNILQPLS